MGERPWILRQIEAYVHVQETPMEEVTITHKKGKLYPPTILVDANGHPFETLIESIDKNTIVVKLNLAVIFTAYIY